MQEFQALRPDISPGPFLLRVGDPGLGEDGFLIVVFHTNKSLLW